MAGYSGTPLAKKLGIKEGFRLSFVNAPAGFRSYLGELPPGVNISTRSDGKQFDLILLFARSERGLQNEFLHQTTALVQNGMLWVAWPKKSSGVKTDLSFDVVQRIGLDAGLVDVKICAVDETWSGLKFVYRLKDRNKLKK